MVDFDRRNIIKHERNLIKKPNEVGYLITKENIENPKLYSSTEIFMKSF